MVCSNDAVSTCASFTLKNNELTLLKDKIVLLIAKQNNDYVIEYTAASRGSYQQININIDATTLSIDNQFFEKTKTVVFPTVSNGEFSIISNTSLGKTTIEIFNINGQRVFINNLNFSSGNKENISTNGLASGVYILRLSAESAQGTKKIIIK